MAEFIDEKSPKAKGKRLSTLEISRIEDITPEPAPEEEGEDADSSEGDSSSEADSAEGGGGAEGAASRPHLHEEKQETTISVENVPMTITTHHTHEGENELSLF